MKKEGGETDEGFFNPAAVLVQNNGYSTQHAVSSAFQGANNILLIMRTKFFMVFDTYNPEIFDDFVSDIGEFSLDDLIESDYFEDNRDIDNYPKNLLISYGIALGARELFDVGLKRVDLKPKNIFLNDNFFPQIICFTKPEQINDNEPDSVLYSAPEEIEGESANENSCIYSYGVLLYEIFVGHIQRDNHTLKIPESVNPRIRSIITGCLSIDPLLRPSFSIIIECIESMIESTEIFLSFKEYLKSETPMLNYQDLELIYARGNYYMRIKNIEAGILLLSLAAEQNHLKSQTYLAYMYMNGINVKHDPEKAIHFFSLAAEQNSLDAQLNLGNIYLLGLGVDVDQTKAFYYYLLAAEQNNLYGQFAVGAMYYNGQGVDVDYEKALHYLLPVANMNHSTANSILGHMYYFGQGVEQDYDKAVEYYIKSAEQNDPGGQFGLGNSYYNGHGVEKDYEKALYYYRLAKKNEEIRNHLKALYAQDFI